MACDSTRERRAPNGMASRSTWDMRSPCSIQPRSLDARRRHPPEPRAIDTDGAFSAGGRGASPRAGAPSARGPASGRPS
jgi:hypothetical protein